MGPEATGQRKYCPSAEKKRQVAALFEKELNKLSHIWYLMKEKRVKVDGLKVILEMEERGMR